MKTFLSLLISITLLSSCSSGPLPRPYFQIGHPLKLKAAIPIIGSESTELSGLTFYKDHLLTISDDDSKTIYEIVHSEASAIIKPFLPIKLPPEYAHSTMDWEAIEANPLNDKLYLLSERHHIILEVYPSGDSRVYLNFENEAKKAGFIQHFNAAGEGLAIGDDGTFYIAFERQPRGLLVIDPQKNFHSYLLNSSQLNPIGKRPLDFSDLCFNEKNLWVISRNTGYLHRLEKTTQSYEEKDFWYFGQISNAPEYAYNKPKFGLMEGLAIRNNVFYAVEDRNRRTRLAHPHDKRTLLFVMTK